MPKYNPRSHRREAPCPSHSYSTIEQELAVKPSQSVGGVKFGNTPRETHREALCPSHSYSTIEQELAVIPSHSVGGVKFGSTPRDILMPVRTNCPVHVYQEAKSMLSSKASATFATDLPRRDAFQQTTRSLAPVHAYAAPLSTLKTAGGVAFGSTAPRAGLLTSVSRTGLLAANITPRRTPLERPRRAAPKLAPIAAEKVHAAEEGDGSPRDVEAIFA